MPWSFSCRELRIRLAVDHLFVLGRRWCWFVPSRALAFPPVFPVRPSKKTIRAGLAVACRRRLHLSFLRDAGSQYLLVPAIPLLRQIFENFGKLAGALRQRYGQRQPFEIQDEYDVQDITSGLLKLHFDEVRRETWTPPYAGNASRVDFVLPQTKVVVEAKMTRASLTQRALVDQLIVDRERNLL